MKVGSLFTGYGGLDIAVSGDLAWYSEIDKPACKVLQTHYPNVPNLGDITKVDWAHVEPVDVITGGYPCQPFSHAGLRKGKNDERHLWPYVRDAIDALRPRYAILENVSGHLTLGFGDVLADLATIGFNAEWGIIRASDVGAPHGRKRLFIIAYPNNASRKLSFGKMGLPNFIGRNVAYPDSQGLQGSPSRSGETQTKRHGHFEQGTSSSTNSDSASSETLNNGRPRDGFEGRLQPMERNGSIAADTEHNGFITSEGRRGIRARSAQGRGIESAGNERQSEGSSSSQLVTDWGKYAPAIERWERVIGRPAPSPTIWHKDRQRLNPVFVEWMMGLDEGHVTGHGLSAAQELKMLGNGVVPLQARAAIIQLLERITP
jgi:DNA (cytosine-5)-methyltransferase 1